MTSEAGVHRASDLMGMEVRFTDGRRAGRVNDVRALAPAGTTGYGGLVVDGFIVSGRPAGSMLGYDRRREQGPWLIRMIVQRMHRDAGYAAWRDVKHVSWDERRITLGVDTLQRLEAP